MEPWSPTGLRDYLLELQREYRIEPVPKHERGYYSRILSLEAEKKIFNADHILLILAGLPGPWLDPHFSRENLPFKVSLLQHLQQMEDDDLRKNADRRLQNRQVRRAENVVRSFKLSSEACRQILLKLLERQTQTLSPPRRLSRSGITQPPHAAASRQSFWTPIVLQLVSYLTRTTREVEGQIFAMTARILHLASEKTYPDKPSLVKQRWYRAL